MRAIVQAALYHLQHQIQQSQATIHLPETWPHTHGYAPWIEEVWINYLSNAFKYGGNPPIITIEVEQIGGNSVRFWVQDNGPGIPADQQDQLFTPFTRLRPSKIQGHGLGLSIVQRIVSKLGGQVGVESQPNQGSRFFFTLPVGPSVTE
jgi:signal transduction histidine kinase